MGGGGGGGGVEEGEAGGEAGDAGGRGGGKGDKGVPWGLAGKSPHPGKVMLSSKRFHRIMFAGVNLCVALGLTFRILTFH